MRFEGKTEAEAVEAAAQSIGVPSAELKYRVVRDEKSFWGGRVVEIRRRPGAEMLFELIGDDVEPLLAGGGEGLSGLEVLTGRIASKELGRPVYPRLDAEGFRAHQRESLEELALASAEEAKRTRRPQLLPPLSPAERRLIHLALAEDPEVETQSEGDGFLKRVAVRPKAS